MSKFRIPSREELINIREKGGAIKPEKDNLIVEGYQGTMGGMLSTAQGVANTVEKVTGSTKLKDEFGGIARRNQQWNSYSSYSVLSLNPVDISRTVGTGIGITLAAIIIFFILYIFLRKNIIGNKCRVCNHIINKNNTSCPNCETVYRQKPQLNKIIKFCSCCFIFLIVIFWLAGFCVSLENILAYIFANICVFVTFFTMWSIWLGLPPGTSIKDAQRQKEKKDELTVAALDELDSGQLNKLTWAKALKKSKGDEKIAKAIYIGLREKEL